MKQVDVFGKCLLAELLEKSRKSQSDLSAVTGIQLSQIGRYINDPNCHMSLKTARIISRALRCTIDDLYEWKI